MNAESRGRFEAYAQGDDTHDWTNLKPSEVRALLAAYDAQAARLAAWEQHACPQYRQHHQSRLVQLRRTLAERDALAVRLAAMEQVVAAAEAWAAQHIWSVQWGCQTCAVLGEAVAVKSEAVGLPDVRAV